MKSSKQRRDEIRQGRLAKRAKQAARATERPASGTPEGGLPVNAAAIAPFNSYGQPDFMLRGFYLDRPFRCRGCGAEEVWTASQQKWWFEVAKGYPYSRASRCHDCRRRARARLAAQKALQVALASLDSTSAEALAKVAELYVDMERPDLAIGWIFRARKRTRSDAALATLDARLAALRPPSSAKR